MHLLVTGGSGFIGSNFIRYWLTNHPQDQVTNLDALTYAGNAENLADFSKNKNYTFIHGDIRDVATVHRAMEAIDVVVHFAAESHVDRSIEGGKAFLDTNLLGTFTLLQEAKARGNQIKRFHHISTDEVFGSLPLDPNQTFDEATPYDPRSPYSASKASSDHICRAFFHTHGLPITISNCSNNYGPYHFPEKFIPLAITNLINGKPIPVYGSGKNVRDWLHVEDHCRAIEAILLRGTVGETYCIGGNQESSNLELAKSIIRLMGRNETSSIAFVEDRKGHDLRYAINAEKIHRELGWRPRYTLEEGLRQTIAWFEANRGWWEPLLERAKIPTAAPTSQPPSVAPSPSPLPSSHPMKILIFGTGYVGSRLAETWATEAVTSTVRIDDRQAVLAEIERHAPDVVVNAAGKAGTPNVDWCETHQLETLRSNTIGALVLAEACQEKGLYLLHLATGCVFYDESPRPEGWHEDDFGNPEAFYTRTKYATDLILSRLPNIGLVRFRMPVDHLSSPKNLIDKLAKYPKVIDVENSMTILDDLVDVCYQLLQKRGTGIFHAVNEGTIRHREILELYRTHVDPTHQCEWIGAEDLVKQGLAIRKRSNIKIQSTRLQALGITMRPIKQAMEDTVRKYAFFKQAKAIEHAWNLTISPKKRDTKGVITAGGMGTRLLPLTSITNKHLLPIFNQPMILYPLQTLIRTGIKDIIIITGPEYAHQFIKLLGSGRQLGCQISYRIQDESGGIAQAVGMAADFVGESNALVLLGDNIFTESFADDVHRFKGGAQTFYQRVDHPQQYGVVEVDAQGNVLSIEEKPKQPKSPFAQLGAYLYDADVFEIIRSLKPSARGELEISEVNDTYRQRGRLTAREITSQWFDAGTFRDLQRAGDYFAEQQKATEQKKNAA